MADIKPKVLLVEDDPFMASLVASAFEKDGFEVVLANDGDTAIAKMVETKPEIAVMDILLPKKNGIEAIREMRLLPEGANLPIVIISNLEDATYVQDAQKLKVDAYLVKANVQISEIITMARDMWKKSREK